MPLPIGSQQARNRSDGGCWSAPPWCPRACGGLRSSHGSVLRYRASKFDCDVCALKMQCCPNTPARQIPRDIHEDARDLARRLMGTKCFLKSRDERKLVEMRFAASQNPPWLRANEAQRTFRRARRPSKSKFFDSIGHSRRNWLKATIGPRLSGPNALGQRWQTLAGHLCTPIASDWRTGANSSNWAPACE